MTESERHHGPLHTHTHTRRRARTHILTHTHTHTHTHARANLAILHATQRKRHAGFGVDGYPTLKWFAGQNRPSIEFNGGRTAADIVAWVTKKSGPNPIPITSIEAADTATKDTPNAVYGSVFASVFLGGWRGGGGHP
jgi:hypothetical protein